MADHGDLSLATHAAEGCRPEYGAAIHGRIHSARRRVRCSGPRLFSCLFSPSPPLPRRGTIGARAGIPGRPGLLRWTTMRSVRRPAPVYVRSSRRGSWRGPGSSRCAIAVPAPACSPTRTGRARTVPSRRAWSSAPNSTRRAWIGSLSTLVQRSRSRSPGPRSIFGPRRWTGLRSPPT